MVVKICLSSLLMHLLHAFTSFTFKSRIRVPHTHLPTECNPISCIQRKKLKVESFAAIPEVNYQQINDEFDSATINVRSCATIDNK